MVSAYAQSGKLFGARSSIHSSTANTSATKRKMFHKATPRTTLKTPLVSDLTPAPVAESRPGMDGDWLNRMSTRGGQSSLKRPDTIEASMGDVPMSQLTDDCSLRSSSTGASSLSSHAQPPLLAKQRELFSSSSKQRHTHQVLPSQALPNQAYPSPHPTLRTTSARFSNLVAPLRQPVAAHCTPRASGSGASVRKPYQFRNQNKNQRVWMQDPKGTPNRASLPLNQQSKGSSISKQEPAGITLRPFHTPRSVKDSGGFSFSRPRNSDLDSCTSVRSSVVTLQRASESVFKGQMELLEQKAASLKESLGKAHESNLADLQAFKMTSTTCIQDSGEKERIRLHEVASEKERDLHVSFERQKENLVDSVLPTLKQKVHSMITTFIQGPSILKMIEGVVNRRKEPVPSNEPSQSLKPNKTSSKKNRATVVAKKSKVAKHTVSPTRAPLRRSKRLAVSPTLSRTSTKQVSNKSSEVGPTTVSVSTLSPKRDAKTKVQIDSTSPSPVTSPQTPSRPDTGVTQVSVTTEPSPIFNFAKKRKKVFGRLRTSIEGSLGAPVSPEASPVRARKRRRNVMAACKTPVKRIRIQTTCGGVDRIKLGRARKKKTNQKSPIVIEDTFDFEF